MNKNIKLLPLSLCVLGLMVGCSTKGSEPSSNYSSSFSQQDSSSQSSQSSSSENPDDPYNHDPDDPYRVLFLGNSLVFFNDMPKIFETLANQQGIPVYVDSVTQGSCTMSLFASTTVDIGYQANYKLTTEKWDYVIIEPSRRATPFEDTVFNAELDAAEILDELAVASGAKTLIYSVWGINSGTTGVYEQTGINTIKTGTHAITRSAHCNYMSYFGEAVSERLGGRDIIRAGYAFENCIAEHSDINLYHTDNQHPSPAGSYLVACTIFNTIFNDRISGANYTYNLSFASTLQNIADKTMIDGVTPILDPIPQPDPAPPESDQKVLLIGAPNLMRDTYHPELTYPALLENLGQTVQVDSVLHSSYTIKEMASSSTTKGQELRQKLASEEYNAIIIQVSRRATTNSTDVTASELAAIQTLGPVLKAETNNVFIFAPKGTTGQTTFVNEGENYTKGVAETATGRELCAFYTNLAKQMADSINVKSIDYASSYLEFKDNYLEAASLDISDEGTGYLYACCFYNSIFESAIPNTATWQNGISNLEAETARAAAKKYCLVAE